jgi:radical SAM superfamily enzyme YgiQ (UPF0313 family)
MSDIVLVKLESIGSETDDRGFHPPFGILYLADTLEKAGFNLKLVHEEGTENNIQRLIDIISTEKPSFVGFSVVTGPQIIPSLIASKKIKERFDIPVIWGGLQPTILPDMTLQKEYIDLLVIGEGEKTIVELSYIITEKGMKPSELKKIKGIAFKKNGKVVCTPYQPFIQDLDNNHTAWHYLDIERYIRPEIYMQTSLAGERTLAVNTSRGCPWRCGYCYNLLVNKRIFRAQSSTRVIQEVEELKKRYKITAIRFSEDHFFSNRKRALDIIRNIGLPWNATIRVDDLTNGGDEFTKTLSENQCALLRCGVESGSQRILDLIKKDITLDQVRKAAGLCEKHNLKVGFFFMLGFPGETWADACKTLDLMDELEGMSECLTAAMPTLFCAFPGTTLLETALEKGFKSPDSLEGWGSKIDVIVKNSGDLPAYVDKRVERAINYMRIIRQKNFNNTLFSIPAKIINNIAKWRWKNRFFYFPIDWHIANLGWSSLKKLRMR